MVVKKNLNKILLRLKVSKFSSLNIYSWVCESLAKHNCKNIQTVGKWKYLDLIRMSIHHCGRVHVSFCNVTIIVTNNYHNISQLRIAL